MRGSGKEKSQQLQGLKSDQLGFGAQHFEHGPNSAFAVEGWDQGGRVVTHQGHKHLERIRQAKNNYAKENKGCHFFFSFSYL